MTVPHRVFLLRKKKQKLNNIKKHRVRNRKYTRILASRKRKIAVLRQIKNPDYRFTLTRGSSKLLLQENKRKSSKNTISRRPSPQLRASYSWARPKRKYTPRLATMRVRYTTKRSTARKGRFVTRKITRNGRIARRNAGFKRKFIAKKTIHEWIHASKRKANRLIFVSKRTGGKWMLIPKQAPKGRERNLRWKEIHKTKIITREIKQQKITWKPYFDLLRWSGMTNAEKMRHLRDLRAFFEQKNKTQNAA